MSPDDGETPSASQNRTPKPARTASASGKVGVTQIAEWVRTSYTLVAPKKLARLVLIEDGLE
jgi:hypothetical protein